MGATRTTATSRAVFVDEPSWRRPSRLLAPRPHESMTIPISRLRRAASLLLLGIYPGCSGLPFPLPTTAATNQRAPQAERHSKAQRSPTANATSAPSDSASAADACMATAREMEAHADHLAAVEQYERARSLDPDRRDISPHLAVLYDQLGDQKRAAKEYAVALKENAQNAELWNDYAYFQFQCGEIDDAESSARKAIELDPRHKRSWVHLGVILAEQQRYDEAYDAFAHAVNPAAAHNNLGIILARQGRTDDARRELAEAQRLDPTLRQPPQTLQQLSEEFVRVTHEEAMRQGEPPPKLPATKDASHKDASAAAPTSQAPRTAAQNSAPIYVNDSAAEDDLHVHAATRSPTRDASRGLRR
ncbi:MAG: hypothetical protein C0483_08405 [Pirellula sp.]|nr:hypothetical protein [Pirellula sp.]